MQSSDKMTSLSALDMLYIRQLIKDRSGMVFVEDKDTWIESRLIPLVRENSFKNSSDLTTALRQGRAGLSTQVVNAVLNHETWFYRDGKIFDALEQLIFPTLLKNLSTETLRVWSAGCAWGQEAYSIAFLLKQLDIFQHFKVDIIATDMASTVIDYAKRGLYTDAEVNQGVGPGVLKNYFKKHHEEWQIDVAIRNTIKFQLFNLLSDFKTLGKFDIIFCRNVLSGFDAALKTKVIDSLSKSLNSKGYLVTGLSETLMGYASDFQSVPGARGVYTLK